MAANSVTLELQQLASVTVSKCDLDRRLRVASLKFRVESLKTHNMRLYQISIPFQSSDDRQAIIDRGWERVWSESSDHVIAFAKSEVNCPVIEQRFAPLKHLSTPVWVSTQIIGERIAGFSTSEQLIAQGADFFTLVSGSLPYGMTLSSAGLIAGTPEAGSFSFKVAAVNSDTKARTDKSFAMSVRDPPFWTTDTIPAIALGSDTTVYLLRSPGTESALMDGTIPSGLRLTTKGMEGVPDVPGYYNFTLRAQLPFKSTYEAGSWYADQQFEATVYESLLNTQGIRRLPDIATLEDWILDVHVPGAHALEIVSGIPGTHLDGATVTGAPALSGTYALTIRASSHLADVYTDFVYNVNVIDRPVFKLATQLPDLPVGEAFKLSDLAIHATSYTHLEGSLPLGMQFFQSGTIAGTPSAAGQYRFLLRAYGSDLIFADQWFDVRVEIPPKWQTLPSLQAAPENESYFATLRAQGAVSYSAATVPEGLTFQQDDGTLAGTPTAEGQYTIDVTAYATSQIKRTRTFILQVAKLPQFSDERVIEVQRGTQFRHVITAKYAAAYELHAGILPPSSILTSAGELTGTPEKAGVYSFHVRALSPYQPLFTDSIFTVRVSSMPIWLSPSQLEPAVTGQGVDFMINTLHGVEHQLLTRSLPVGLSMDPSGRVHGIASQRGSFTFTVRAVSDSSSVFSEKVFTMEVATIPSWETPTHLSPLRLLDQATVQLQARDADQYEMILGSLPTGLALSGSGCLQGTPVAPGLFTFKVRAKTSVSSIHSDKYFSLLIAEAPAWQTIALPVIESNTPVNIKLNALASIEYALVAGDLQDGLQVTRDGYLQGTALATGQATIVVRAYSKQSSATQFSSDRSFELLVQALPVWDSDIADMEMGMAVDVLLHAQSANAYTVLSGTLPNGISLDTDGRLHGTPNSYGLFSVLIQASNSASHTRKQFDFLVSRRPMWKSTTVPPMSSRLASTFVLEADYATSFNLISGGIPLGTSLTVDGKLQGTPTEDGTFIVTIRASDGNLYADQAFTIVVDTAPSWQTDALPVAESGIDMEPFQLHAVGATQYQALTTLPAGVKLDNTGTLSGTAPVPDGSYDVHKVTLRASDMVPSYVYSDKSFDLVVARRPVWLPPTDEDVLVTQVQTTVFVSAEHADSYRVVSGTLPTGMALWNDRIVGYPTVPGSFTFVLCASNHGIAADVTRTLVVADRPKFTAELFEAEHMQPFQQRLRSDLAQGYELVSGSLPDGLALDTDGTIHGVPTRLGYFQFSAKAWSQSSAAASTQDYGFVVGATVTWKTEPVMAGMQTGVPYLGVFEADDALQYSSPDCPMTLMEQGTWSWTPPRQGDYEFTLFATGWSAMFSKPRTFTVNVSDPPVWSGPVALPDACVSGAYSTRLTAKSALRYELIAGALPDGLAFETIRSQVVGVPVRAGLHQFTLRAFGSNNYVFADQTFTVLVAERPVWSTLASHTVGAGRAMSIQLSAEHAVTYSVVEGTLPNGMSLTPKGLLVDPSPEAGTVSFTVRASAECSVSGAQHADRTFIVAVIAAPEWATDAELPETGVADDVFIQLHADGATSYKLLSGALPEGVLLHTYGTLEGSALQAGNFQVEIRALHMHQAVAYSDRIFTWRVWNRPLWGTSTSSRLACGLLHDAQMAAVQMDAGAETYQVRTGSLPTGLQLSAAGVLTGTPTVVGTFVFTVSACNGPFAVDKDFEITVVRHPQFQTTFLKPANMFEQGTWSLVAGWTTAFVCVSGAVPPGLALYSDGTLTGIPTEEGTYAFKVRAIGTKPGFYADMDLSLTVEARPSWQTPAELGTLASNEYHAIQLYALAADDRCKVVSGRLPTGMMLSEQNLLAGIPTELGQFEFTVRAVSDSSDAILSDRAFSLFVSQRCVWVTSGEVRYLETLQPVELQLFAGTGAETYVALDPLPVGLSLSPSGLMNGTPSEVQHCRTCVRALGTRPEISIDRVFEFVCEARPQWSTVPDTLTASDQLFAMHFCEHCTSAASFAVLSGTPPAPLSVGGFMEGVPVAGEFNFVLRAFSKSGRLFADSPVYMSFSKLPVWVEPDSLAALELCEPMPVAALSAMHATRYEIVSGALPAGVSLSEGGEISGVPAVTGDYSFAVRASGAVRSVFADRHFSLTVGERPVWVTDLIPPLQLSTPFEMMLTCEHADDFGLQSGPFPDGVGLSANGVLRGTAHQVGLFGITVRAHNKSFSTDKHFNVRVGKQPRWDSAADLGNAHRGQYLSFNMKASDAITYSSHGKLPPGLTITDDGTLSGTVNEDGKYIFSLRAWGVYSLYEDQHFTLTVDTYPSWTTDATLPNAGIDLPFHMWLVASDTDSYEHVAGLLPEGLAFSQLGLLCGVPTSAGTFQFTVRAKTKCSTIFADKLFTLLTAAVPDWLTEHNLEAIPIGDPYTLVLQAAGAENFTLLVGSLPQGLSLAADGTVSGTPTIAESTSFTVRAHRLGTLFSDRVFALQAETKPTWITPAKLADAIGEQDMALDMLATGAVSYVVSSILTDNQSSLQTPSDPEWQTPSLLDDAGRGVSMSVNLKAANADSYSLMTDLPAGLSMNENGVLQGAPSDVGSYLFVVRATRTWSGVDYATESLFYDSVFADRTFRVTVADVPLWVTAPDLAHVATNEPCSFDVIALHAGTYATTCKCIPPGMFLSDAGMLSGTPTVAGVYDIAVRAVSLNAPGIYADRTFHFSVASRPKWITSPELGDVATGEAISIALLANNTERMTATPGPAIPGMTLMPDGQLVGTPLLKGTQSIVVTAFSVLSEAIYATRSFTLVSVPRPQWITPAQFPSGALGEPSPLPRLSATDAIKYQVISGHIPGLSLSDIGLVSGSIDETGTFSVTVMALGSDAVYVDREFTIAVAVRPKWVTDGTLPDAAAGEPMLIELQAIDGYRFEALPGQQIPGLDVTDKGLLVGMPTGSGNVTVRVYSTSLDTVYSDRMFTMTVAERPKWQSVLVSPQDLVLNEPFTAALTATACNQYSIASGAIRGLELQSDGILQGVPVDEGLAYMTVRAFSYLSMDIFADRTFVEYVTPRPSWITQTLPDVAAFESVSVNVTADFATTYELLFISHEMSMRADGFLSGTLPDGEITLTVRAFSTNSVYADRQFNFVSAVRPTWFTEEGLPDVARDEALDLPLIVGDSTTLVQLPGNAWIPGVTLVEGRLVGAPTTEGEQSVTVRAYSSASNTIFADRIFRTVVAVRPVWDTAVLEDIAVDEDASISFVSINALTYVVIRGVVPGLDLDGSTGVLSGAPTTEGIYSFDVRSYSANSLSIYATRSFTLNVATRPVWLTSAVEDIAQDEHVSIQLAADYTQAYALVDGDVPGLTLSNDGMLTGAATMIGANTITVRAVSTTSLAIYSERTFTVHVARRPRWSTVVLADVAFDEPWAFALPAAACSDTNRYVLVSCTPENPGVQMTHDGILSGTPALTGDFTFVVRAFSITSDSIYSDVELPVSIVIRPSWGTAILPDLALGEAYQIRLTASDCNNYAILSGSIPMLLQDSVDSALLQGTPTAVGTYEIAVRAYATGSQTVYADRTFTQIVAVRPTWTTSSLPAAAVDEPYSFAVSAADAGSYAIVDSTVPAIRLNAATLNGVCTDEASGSVTIRAFSTLSMQLYSDRTFDFAVCNRPVWSSGAELPDTATNEAYHFALETLYAVAWDLQAGSLPNGVTLAGNVLSGTPTHQGHFSFTIRAYASSSEVYLDMTFAVRVATRPRWQTTSIPDVASGESMSFQFSASNSGVYTLLDGLAVPLLLSSQGTLSGTPTPIGTYAVTVRCFSDTSTAIYADASFTLLVARRPTWLTSDLADAAKSEFLSFSVGASDCASYAVTDSLPEDLSMDSIGNLQGTVLNEGLHQFTVRAFSSTSTTIYADRTFTLNVAVRPQWLTHQLNDVALWETMSTFLEVSNCSHVELTTDAVPGVNLDKDTGELHGKPSAPGTYSVGFRAFSYASLNIYNDVTLTLTVAIRPAWILSGPFDFARDELLAFDFVAEDGWRYAVVQGQLPEGIDYSIDGQLTGIPSMEGLFPVVIRAYSQTSSFIYADKACNIVIEVRPTWVTETMQDMAMNEYTEVQFLVANGFYFSMVGAGIPGLDLTSAGTLSGGPTTVGSYTLTIRATSKTSLVIHADRTFIFEVALRPAWITPSLLPDAARNEALMLALVASNSHDFELFETLPGLQVRPSDGTLEGVPTVSAAYVFNVRAYSDTSRQIFADSVFTLTIATRPAWITPTVLADIAVDEVCAIPVVADAVGSLTYATAAQVPGMEIDGDDMLVGTPTETGTYHITLRAYSSTSMQIYTDRDFSLHVALRPVWQTAEALEDWAAGEAMTCQLSAAYGIDYQTVSGGLPGLLLGNDGTLAGFPIHSGVMTVRAFSTTSVTIFADRTFTLVVSARPIWSRPTELPDVGVSEPVSFELTAANGSSYAALNGIPVLECSPQGFITGTVVQQGLFSLTVRAFSKDSLHIYADASFALNAAIRPVWVTPENLAPVAIHEYITLDLVATSAFSFEIVSGGVPGMTLDPMSGALDGMATIDGDFVFVVRAYSETSLYIYSDRSFSLQTCVRPVWITASLPDAAANEFYSATLSADHAGRYELLSNSMSEFSLQGAGVSGTPTQGGQLTVRCYSTTSSEIFADRTFNLIVSKRPEWLSQPPSYLALGELCDIPLLVQDAYRIAIVQGHVPGINVFNGALAGTPSVRGQYQITVRANSELSDSIYSDCTMNVLVTQRPMWLTTSLPDTAALEQYTFQLGASYAGGFAIIESTADWCALSADGVLAGLPTQAGNYSLTFRSYSLDTTEVYADQALNIHVAVRPTWETASELGDVAKDESLNITFTATNCSNYQFLNDPVPGLTFTSLGLLSGFPTADGTYVFTVRGISDTSDTIFADRQFTLLVASRPTWTQHPDWTLLQIGDQVAYGLPDAALGEFMSQIIASDSSLMHELTSAPSWVTCSPTGELSGTPDKLGVSSVTVRVYSTTSISVYADMHLQVFVAVRPTWTTGTALDDVATNDPFMLEFVAQDSAYLSVVACDIPGLTWQAPKLVGAPSVQGMYSLTLRATSMTSPLVYADRTFQLVVATRPQWMTPTTLPDVAAKEQLQYQVTSNHEGSYALMTGPAWITCSSSGKLSGLPPTTETATLIIRAFSSLSTKVYMDKEFNLHVALRPQWVTEKVKDMAIWESIALSFVAAYALKYESMYSPQWCAFFPLTGKVTGTPDAEGSDTFAIRAYSKTSLNIYSDRTFTFTVATRPLWITRSPLPDAAVNESWSMLFEAKYATRYTASGGWPIVSADGTATGSPVAGKDYVTVRAYSQASNDIYAEKVFSIFSATRPTWLTTSLPDIAVDEPFSMQLQVQNASALELKPDGPGWISLTASGLISGIPPRAYQSYVSIRAYSSTTRSLYSDIVIPLLVATRPVWITPASFPPVSVGSHFSIQLEATYGYEFQLLDAFTWLSVSKSGVLEGVMPGNATVPTYVRVRAYSLESTSIYADSVFSLRPA